MMDVGAIRAAVVAAAANATPPTGHTRKLVAKPYLEGVLDPPWCYPADVTGDYKQSVGGAGMVVTLRVLTSRSEDKAGQELLDAYLADSGASSVAAAVEAAMPGAAVMNFEGYRMYEIAGTPFFGAELTVVILA
jgi:hypothetical protein